jgi:hypothetical protein
MDAVLAKAMAMADPYAYVAPTTVPTMGGSTSDYMEYEEDGSRPLNGVMAGTGGSAAAAEQVKQLLKYNDPLEKSAPSVQSIRSMYQELESFLKTQTKAHFIQFNERCSCCPQGQACKTCEQCYCPKVALVIFTKFTDSGDHTELTDAGVKTPGTMIDPDVLCEGTVRCMPGYSDYRESH